MRHGAGGLGAAVYGASEGLDTLIIDSTALGGQRAKVRRPVGDPYRAHSLETGNGRRMLRLEDDREIAALAVVLATGAQYRCLPVEALSKYEGVSVFYAAGAPEAQLCGAERVAVLGGGNSGGQAAVWLARGGALVTLLHRRADLHETMSDYPRARALRRGHPQPQRDCGAARRRRRTRGRDAGERRAPAALVLVSVPRRTALHRVARRRRHA